jgi:hypothetical protein
MDNIKLAQILLWEGLEAVVRLELSVGCSKRLWRELIGGYIDSVEVGVWQTGSYFGYPYSVKHQWFTGGEA